MIKDFSTLESATMWLLAQGTQIASSVLIKHDIAVALMGENAVIADDFMSGNDSQIKPFLANVVFNSQLSHPLILRAIQIHLITKDLLSKD